MAKPTDDKPSEEEPIDSTLDSVLVSALRRNFEIKSGHHIDRNEILDFLRSVIQEHPELNFVLQHRDTKLSSRIYKAFPKVTTKRVAVPSARGKKTYPSIINCIELQLNVGRCSLLCHFVLFYAKLFNLLQLVMSACKPNLT